jgi:hypothetical protein
MNARAVAALSLCLTALLAGQAQASPPPPPPDDLSEGGYFGEAPTGVHTGRYDDVPTSELTVLPDRRVLWRHFGVTPSGEDGELALYFNTRGGSRFYLTGCDEQNRQTEPVRVARTTFLRRIAVGHEREMEIVYDARRNRGDFVVTIGHLVDGDLLPCPGLPQ